MLKQIKDALAAAVASRKSALDSVVDTTKPDPANPIPYADAALQARRYGAVIDALTPAFMRDQKNPAVGERLAYAQLRINRTQDAVNTLRTLQRAGGNLGAYGSALKAAAFADAGDDAGSDEAMRDAVLAESDNLGVRTAQAYIALKRNNLNAISRISADLSKDAGQRPDVRYFQMAVAARNQEYSQAQRAFESGVLAEPAAADLYVEYANDAIAITQRANITDKDKAQHYAEARVYFETALIARPEAAEALAGLAMVAAFEGKGPEAVRYALAATKAAPNDAGSFYALTAAQSLARNSAAAQIANNRAGRLDPKYLSGRQIPDAPAVWRYLGTSGRPVVMIAPV